MNTQLHEMEIGGDYLRRTLRTVAGERSRRGLILVLLAAFASASTLTTAVAKPPPGGNTDKTRIRAVPPTGSSGETIPVEGAVMPIPAAEVKGPHPIAKPDETTHDFGSVWVGPPLKHAFKIKNEGDAPLEISKVKPSCGCTVAGDYPKKLDPGQEGEFPFSMMSTKLRGPFDKGITISTNDPTTPELRLKLKGDVKRYVEIVPASANFGKITGQEPQERVVNITNNTDNPLQLTLVPPADSKFKYDLVEKTQGKQFDLHVTAAPPFEEGTLKGTVTLNTNVEAQKDLQVEVMAVVPARLEVQPAVVTLTGPRAEGTPSADGLSRVIKFTNYGNTPTKVLEATVDDPTVTVSVTERKAGEAYTIQVQMPPGYAPPPEGRTITLKTDDAKKPIITVPIQAPPVVPTITERKQLKPAEPLVGQPAPVFSLQTLEGKPLNNETLTNKVTVLDFFAPNCGVCKQQIPRLETVRAKYADKGVRFVNVSEKMGAKDYSQDEVVEVIKGLGFKGELALDPANAVGPLFKANSYPTMIVVGKSGKVEAVNNGNIIDLETRVAGQIDALLAGKPVPADPPTTQVPPTDATKGATKDKGTEAPKRARPEDLVGQAAPSFALTTLEGKPVSNAELAKGPATVLNFFAPNCPHCKHQIPRLETVRKTYVSKGVRFVNVAESMGKPFTEEDTVKILKDLGAELEVARDPENKFGPLFNATGFPTMVVVGKSGKVEAVNVGNIPDLEMRLQGQLDALIAGKPIPQVAAAAPAKPALPSQPTAPAEPPQPPQRPAMQLVGQPAPAFSIDTLEGKKVSSDDFKNHPATVLNFVAPNCPHCKKQLPNVESIRAEYEAKGVRFVNLAQKMGAKEFTTEEIVDVFKGVGSRLELVKDTDNQIGQMFKAVSFPTMVVVNKNGKIEHVNIGDQADLDKSLKGQLDGLIAGKPAGGAPGGQ